MNRMIFLAAAVCLGASTWAAASQGEDGLTALEQNPSPSATARVASIYHRSKDPYSRLWLMDVLYRRVIQYHDSGAMELLWEAAKDANPDVRRKAIGDLEAFQFLSESQGRELWLERVRGIVHVAGKDPSPAVKSAGQDLGIAVERLEAERAKLAPPQAGLFKTPRFSFRLMAQIFVWMVFLQLIGYGWHRIGMHLLTQAGASGQAVLKTVTVFKKHPSISFFPLAMALLVFILLGISLGWKFFAAAMPPLDLEQAEKTWRTWETFAVAYLTCGAACFLLASLMTGMLVGGLRASIRRIFGFCLIGILGLVLVWPLETAWRLTRARWKQWGPFFWMAKTGTPFAALLTSGVMVQEKIGVWRGLCEAARRFSDAAKEPGAEFWGRAPFQIPFFLWCLASPALFSISLVLAFQIGFHPAQLFSWWFISDAQFAVGFGWWMGILLSAVSLSQITVSGAVRAAQMVREAARPAIERRVK